MIGMLAYNFGGMYFNAHDNASGGFDGQGPCVACRMEGTAGHSRAAAKCAECHGDGVITPAYLMQKKADIAADVAAVVSGLASKSITFVGTTYTYTSTKADLTTLTLDSAANCDAAVADINTRYGVAWTHTNLVTVVANHRIFSGTADAAS